MVQALLGGGADAAATDSAGDTALHWLAASGGGAQGLAIAGGRGRGLGRRTAKGVMEAGRGWTLQVGGGGQGKEGGQVGVLCWQWLQ